jgi:hypothetical protein
VDLHSPSLTISRKLMASPPVFHPARSHFCSWVLLAPFSLKGTSLQHSWLLRLLPNVFAWLFRMLGYQSGWYFLSAHSVCVHRFFSACLTCMLSTCLTYLLLSLCTNMWRRSRAPCSCPNCISEELREQFCALRTDVRRVEERTDARHREFQRENQGIREELASLQTQLHQQETRHNQELAIALRGININTRQLGVVTQQLANPQQPENYVGSGESRLPSTFHSTTNNDHHSTPSAPGHADLHHAEANPAATGGTTGRP